MYKTINQTAFVIALLSIHNYILSDSRAKTTVMFISNVLVICSTQSISFLNVNYLPKLLYQVKLALYHEFVMVMELVNIIIYYLFRLFCTNVDHYLISFFPPIGNSSRLFTSIQRVYFASIMVGCH